MRRSELGVNLAIGSIRAFASCTFAASSAFVSRRRRMLLGDCTLPLLDPNTRAPGASSVCERYASSSSRSVGSTLKVRTRAGRRHSVEHHMLPASPVGSASFLSHRLSQRASAKRRCEARPSGSGSGPSCSATSTTRCNLGRGVRQQAPPGRRAAWLKPLSSRDLLADRGARPVAGAGTPGSCGSLRLESRASAFRTPVLERPRPPGPRRAAPHVRQEPGTAHRFLDTGNEVASGWPRVPAWRRAARGASGGRRR